MMKPMICTLRGIALVLFAALAVLQQAGAASAQQRVALVIGNAAYRHVGALENPRNDADAMAVALERLGFKVDKVVDGGFDAMRRAILAFSRTVYDSEVAMVFFAGHGMEIGGENWLLPVDAELKTDRHPEQEAISLKSLIAAVSGATKLGLVILDACRDNPFAARMKRAMGKPAVEAGLALIEPTGSVLVAYAAKAGTTAMDGFDRHSPYTAALLTHIGTPQLEIELLFRHVRDDVLAATNQRQEPFLYGALSRDPLHLTPMAPGREGPPEKTDTSKQLLLLPAPYLSMPSETPIDPDILKLVETHPFFAAPQAPPVKLGNYRMTTTSSYVVNRFKGTNATITSGSIRWLRRGIIRSDTAQKITVQHVTCPPGACVTTVRSTATMAGNGLISLAYRATSSSSPTSSSKLVGLDRMQGKIFPAAPENRFSYRATYRVASPAEDEEVSENSCAFIETFDARRFHPKLTGQAVLLTCRVRTTYRNNRAANNTSNSKDLFFTDLGTFLRVDAIEPKQRIVQTHFDNNMTEETVLLEFALAQN